ncbi:hypothetical protein BD626DRAFT_207305 [Schizophyllum amplum]|uniref:BTB domain-containing protein n=1 Tax=Schizophyllum amplum TaxID=97359 RepID=A0A550BYV5_9AGAR|nr:hypothetical protein BD626DRAFT_207305 [Auriculariopsis ampla]
MATGARAEAFPFSSVTLALDETAPVDEEEKTLELLFSFVHLDEHVRLEDVDFPLLARLAEAAEKYQVYSCRVACCFNMRAQHKAHSAEVMAYAARHGHDDILNLAAPYSRELPFTSPCPPATSTLHRLDSVSRRISKHRQYDNCGIPNPPRQRLRRHAGLLLRGLQCSSTQDA